MEFKAASGLRLWAFLVVVSAVAASGCSSSTRNGDAKPKALTAAQATRTPTPAAPSASWARLRVGLKVYTGTDGGDAQTQTICPTLDGYFAAVYDNRPGSCTHVKRGVPA